MKIVIMASSILLFLGLAGCNPTHLVYVHESNLGVVLAPGSGQGMVKFSIGVDRETYALVPQKPNTPPGENGEAMSLASVSRIYVKGINDLKFGHLVATGDAADNVASQGQMLRDVQQELFNKQTAGEGDE